MTTRKNDVDALIKRSGEDLVTLQTAYEKSLHDRTISAELRIDIKNFCGNLRSVLDYLARDIRETHCPKPKPKERFYFPILSDNIKYRNQMANWFPKLEITSVDLWNYLESCQPYHPPKAWIGTFNTLNNENKHDNLVEQSRTESERMIVTFGGGGVDWDPNAVKFMPGVSIGGVPINPATQMPQPHPSQKVERIIWVDFRFAGINESAIGLLKQSLTGISEIADNVYKLL